MRKRILAITAALLLGGGFLLTAKAAYIPLKAHLSVYLLENSWNKTLETQTNVAPWPWMDSTPVAKLSFPDHGKSYVVLSGISGTVLAFAPGWHPHSDKPETKGTTIISAHKDTHFQILKDLKLSDHITMTDKTGAKTHYKVIRQQIVDQPKLKIAHTRNHTPTKSTIILVTCYPFTGMQYGGSRRFLTVAEEI